MDRHPVDPSRKRLAPHVIESVEQVERNARRVQALLRRAHAEVPIIPVVVSWGPNVVPPSAAVRREVNVRVGAGKKGDDWRSSLSRDRTDVDTINGSLTVRMPGIRRKALMARIGHSSPRAALISQHATRERDRRVAEFLDAELSSTGPRASAPVVALPTS